MRKQKISVSTSLVTALSVSGKGNIKSIGFGFTGSTNTPYTAGAQVIVDGTTILNTSGVAYVYGSLYFVSGATTPALWQAGGGNLNLSDPVFDIPFINSFVVNISAGTWETQFVNVAYEIEV